jgi:hypothetical protein
MAEPKKKPLAPPGGLATVFPYLPYFRGEVGKSGLGARPDISDVTKEAADLRAYLGPTDYSKQLQQAQDAAKLQAALSLAARGFASMGATPKKGESPFATIGRELLAPVGADLIPVSTDLMKRKAAIDAARQAEDRQVKLAAYTQAAARKKTQDDITVDLLKSYYASNKKDSGLLADHFVITKDGVPVLENGVPLIGRQRKKGTDTGFVAVTGEKIGEEISMAGRLPRKVSEYFKRPPAGAAPTVQAADYRLIYTRGENKGKPYTIDGGVPIYNTISKGSNIGKVRQKGTGTLLSPTELKDLGLELQKIETPPAPKDPKGMDDPKFKGYFKGFMNQLNRIQKTEGLGSIALKFDATKGNLELDPAKDTFPISRVDGQSLSQEDKTKIRDKFRSVFYNIIGPAYAVGDPVTKNMNLEVARQLLTDDFDDFGLAPRAAGAAVPRGAIVAPAKITQAYSRATFGPRSVAKPILEELPLPSGKNLSSGTARVILFNEASPEMFGKGTTAPSSLGPNNQQLSPDDYRSILARDVDPSLVRQRLKAEALSKKAGLVKDLNVTKTPDVTSQMAAITDALEKVEEADTKRFEKPKNIEKSGALNKALGVIAMLDQMDADATSSGVQGFVTGPLEGFASSITGSTPGNWFRTGAGKEAANRLIAIQPLIKQFVAREFLKSVGEQRISTPDLKGAQKVLPDLGNAEKFEAGKLRALRKHLVNTANALLQDVGEFDSSDETLGRAVQLGFDVGNVKPKNNFYSPYIQGQKYAVTKQDVPAHSPEYLKQLRDNGILQRTLTGNPAFGGQYKLIKTDRNGQPLFTPGGAFQTLNISTSDINDPAYAAMKKFNVDYLKLRHKIAR